MNQNNQELAHVIDKTTQVIKLDAYFILEAA